MMNMDSSKQHHRSHEDAAASVAATPVRKSVKDFFHKISTDEHNKIQDAQLIALSQADIMDLRSVQVIVVRAKKRNVSSHVARTAKNGCVIGSENETEGFSFYI
jgi:hypothetical protein